MHHRSRARAPLGMVRQGASGGGTTPTLDQSTVITPVPSAIENPLALVAKRAAPRLERDETKDVANLGVERTK